MTTTTLQSPRIHAASTAAAARPITRFWQRLWAAVEAHGQRRAAAELRRLAVSHRFTDPTMASRLCAIAAETEAPR
jgi:hypothetical protein